MKYEIIKGSERAFDGEDDRVLVIFGVDNIDGIFRSVNPSNDDFPKDWLIIAERRPITEPVWGGEGLPPVGVECEMHNDRGTWIPVDVIAHKDGFAFGWSYDYRIVLHSDKAEGFRPIRSPEDVARDEEIVLLTDVICGNMPDVGMATAAMFAGRVYDAGYRKLEGK